MTLVNLNGAIEDANRAAVSVFDRGLLFGDGLFETLRAERGEVLLFDRHLGRLCDGLAFLRIRPRLDRAEIKSATRGLLSRLAYPCARVKIVVTRGQFTGDAPTGRFGDPHESTLLITANETQPMGDPVRLRASWISLVRRDPVSPLAVRKTLNYLPSFLATDLAVQRGAEEAILPDIRGFLSEAAFANLFWIREGVLHYPAPSCGPLPGITAAFLLERAEAIGLPSKAVESKPEELQETDLVFVSSSVRGIARIDALDDLEFAPPAESEATFKKLAEDFQKNYLGGE